MKRLEWLLVGVALTLAAILVFGVRTASAAKPTPAAWFGPFWRSTETGVVEQQSPDGWIRTGTSVVNPDWMLPGGCAWDADDELWAGLGGYLGAGESASGTLCLYADTSTHLVALRAGEGLRGTLSLDGYTEVSGSLTCIAGPDYVPEQIAGLPLIEGSNGGHAERVTFTYTVTNVTGKRLRAVDAEVLLVKAGWAPAAVPTGCPYPLNFPGVADTVFPVGSYPQVWTWARAVEIAK